MHHFRRLPLSIRCAAACVALACLMVGVSVAAGATGHGPRIVSIHLTPLAPTRASTVTAAVVAKDLDGARVHLAYRWLRNGGTIAGATGRSIALAGHGFHKGDHVAVRVTANDGTRSVTQTSSPLAVRDTAPRASSLAIDQQTPTGADVLTATLVASDADGDALSEQRAWSWTCPDATSGAAGTMTLDLGARDLGRGCTIGLTDTVSDGQLSAVASAQAVTVVDRAPTIGAVQLSPADPTAADIVTASAETGDPDGDAVTRACAWTVAGSQVGSSDCSLNLADLGANHGDAVSVTMTASDGTLSASGDAATTVADASPVIGSVAIDAASPATNDTVHALVDATDPDGDPIVLTYQWSVNGTPVADATGAAFDLSQAGHGDRGDAVAVQVTAGDGTDESSAGSAPVTIADSTPVLETAAFSTVQPVAGRSISVGPVAATDADGDPVTTSVAWSVNGADAGTGDAITVPAGAVRGDTIRAVISAGDGSDSTTQTLAEPVADAPPVIGSASIDVASPGTNDTVHALVSAGDADGDPLTLGYQWLRNGAAIDGATGSALDLSQAGSGNHGDAISVRVTADDGTAATTATSAPVTVANTAPVLTHAVIHYDASTATATVSTAASDADGDALTTSVRWSVNGEDSGSGSTLDLAASGAHIGDVVDARVWVTDSQHADSSWVMASQVTISGGVPVVGPMNTWHPLTRGYGSPIAAIVPIGGQLDVYEGVGLHRSTDDGASWSDSYNAPCQQFTGAALVADPSSPSTLYAGCDGPGLYRSADGGATWQHVLTPDPGYGQDVHVTAIAVDPIDSGTVYAAGWSSLDWTDVYRSSDGGQTWQSADSHTGRLANSIAIDPGNDQHIVVGTDQGVIVSTDGGATWAGPYGPAATVKVAFDPSDGSRLWAIRDQASTASVLASVDGGVTWTTVAGSPAHLTTLAAAAGMLYVGGTGKIARTTDGGGTWVTYGPPVASTLAPSAMTVDPADPHRVYVGYSDPAGAWQVDLAASAPGGQALYNALRLDGVTEITPTTAMLHATLAPMFHGDSGWLSWNWGTSPASLDSGDLVPIQPSTSEQAVTYPLTGLQPDTTYYVSFTGAIWPDTADGYAADGFAYDQGPFDATFTTPPASGGSTPTDTAPVIHTVTISDPSPVTTSLLHAAVSATDADGDPLSLAYQWLKNGVPIAGATQNSLDLAQPGNGDRGDAISVTVTVTDGIDQTPATSDPVTVANAAPMLPAATITYDAAAGTASVAATATDADGDPLTTTVAWTINGQDAGSAATLDLVAADASIGDTIGASVQVDDGTATSDTATATPVTIATGPPSLVQSPVMPWAVMQASFSVGASVVISTTNASPDNGVTAPPYASAGNCPVPNGATDYRNQVAGSEALCPIAIGQVIATKTGNNAGPTAQGLDTRIAAYQSVDQIAQATGSGGYSITAPDSPQLVRIPIVTNTADGGTTWPLSGNVTVKGWVWAVITGYSGGGAQVDVTIVGSTL